MVLSHKFFTAIKLGMSGWSSLSNIVHINSFMDDLLLKLEKQGILSPFLSVLSASQGRRKRGDRSGSGRPTFF